jgi:hypothetical protein
MDNTWWAAMSSLEHVYWIIAVAASVMLAVQLALAFVSGLEFHMGSDLAAHHDGGFDAPHFQLLTIRNVVAFFAVFGWSGLALYHAGVSHALTIFISFSCGLAMMFIMAAMFWGLSKLQSSGTIDVNGAKGEIAETYLTIPPLRKGTGKIEVILQGKKVEMDALTDDPEKIATGSAVKIIAILNNQAIVERK